MNTIIYTIIVAAIIAILLGILLGLFKKIFHVDTDPKVQLVRDALSGANCGGCGLAGCDAFMTDYSSAAFDAAVMLIPIFLYADDYSDYEKERGSLLWNLRELPFPLAETNDELKEQILNFDDKKYQKELKNMFEKTGMNEDGLASKRIVDLIEVTINDNK